MAYRWTLIGAVTGLLIWLVCFLTDFELFEYLVEIIRLFEAWELDEILIVLLLVLVGLIMDHRLRLEDRNRQIDINRERIRTHQVTMRNVLDIVGNFLHHLQLFILEAEKNKALKPESIASINNMLFETSDRLQEIADLEKIKETSDGDDLTLLDLEKQDKPDEFI